MPDIKTLIADNLDIWTTAIQKKSSSGRGTNKKINFYGIKKLREMILELAVRGKLVQQDLNDEPASILLNKIAAEKVRLVKEGEIKKQKSLPQVSDDKKPFELPLGWKWARIGNIGTVFNGNSISAHIKKGKYEGVEGLPFIATKDVGYGFECFNYNNGVAIPEGEAKFKVAHKNAVFICAEGGSAGKKCGVTDRNICFGNKLFANELFEGMAPVYILTVYLTPFFYRLFSKSMTGIIGGISSKKFMELPVPIPPTEEQHRIVAKVDELMALCDQLEKQTEDSITAHQTLVKTLLATLTQSQSAEEFAQNWSWVADHFDTLFTTENSIDQLKQTILQLAVMGKLVPQDPSDEPASILLKKIAVEKDQLIKEKKIKKHPPVEPLGEQMQLPASWKNIVVQDFSDVRLGSTPSRSEPKYWGGDIAWVSSGEVANKIILDTTEKITWEGFQNSSTSIIPARSLLIAIIGQGKTRGQSALLGIDACTNQNVAALVFNENFIIPEYVWLWAKSKYETHRGGGRGGAQPALNGKIVRSFRFPLPPTKEQHRIVAKVDELIALCDQVKTRLKDAQTIQTHLAKAIVEKAVT
jgi:type I restriction enzyme, S subunit